MTQQAASSTERPSTIWIPSPENVIVRRANAITCTPGDGNAQCAKPVDMTTSATLPITLGAVIPLISAICIFIYLHRRHVKKLRREDKNDKTIALDFGLGPGGNPGQVRKVKKGRGGMFGRRGASEMLDNSPALHRDGRPRGMSMDPGMESPYLLPPELHDSTASLHSLTRSLRDDDKYQPVQHVLAGNVRPDSPYGSVRSFAMNVQAPRDTASDITAAGKFGAKESARRSFVDGTSKATPSAPPHVSQSSKYTLAAGSTSEASSNTLVNESSRPDQSPLQIPHGHEARDSYITADDGDMRRSHMHLAGFINYRDSSTPESASGPVELPARTDSRVPAIDQIFQPNNHMDETSSSSLPASTEEQARDFSRPLRKSSANTTNSNRTTRQSSYSYAENQTTFGAPPSPINEEYSYETNNTYGATQPHHPTLDPGERSDYGHDRNSYYDYNREPGYEGGREAAAHALEGEGAYYQPSDEYRDGSLGAPSTELQRISMGSRPLPPDDPTDTPEQRANRIRSFYKEYFGNDDRQHPPLPPLPPQQPRAEYYEDYSQEYMSQAPPQDGVVDPETGYFYPAPPSAPCNMPMARRAMTPPPRAPPRFRGGPASPSSRHQSSASSGSFYPPGPRAASSASGNMHGQRGRKPGPKPLPPPAPLKTLPTPHKMKDDAALFDASMFAPPPTHQDIASGSRSSSPLGEMRSYKSPKMGHNPLVSSYDELPAMPSP